MLTGAPTLQGRDDDWPFLCHIRLSIPQMFIPQPNMYSGLLIMGQLNIIFKIQSPKLHIFSYNMLIGPIEKIAKNG